MTKWEVWIEISGNQESMKLLDLTMELQIAYGFSDSAGTTYVGMPIRDMQWDFDDEAEAHAFLTKLRLHPLPTWAKLESGVALVEKEELLV